MSRDEEDRLFRLEMVISTLHYERASRRSLYAACAQSRAQAQALAQTSRELLADVRSACARSAAIREKCTAAKMTAGTPR